jgi:hypothetical protein
MAREEDEADDYHDGQEGTHTESVRMGVQHGRGFAADTPRARPSPGLIGFSLIRRRGLFAADGPAWSGNTVAAGGRASARGTSRGTSGRPPGTAGAAGRAGHRTGARPAAVSRVELRACLAEDRTQVRPHTGQQGGEQAQKHAQEKRILRQRDAPPVGGKATQTTRSRARCTSFQR